LENAEVQELDKDAEIVAGFEIQAQQFHQKQEEFSDFMDRLKDNIDEKASMFGYIPYYEATLRDKEYRDMAQSTDQLQDLDPRRKRLLSVNSYVAKFAKLPPPPHVEQKMYDDFAIDLLMEASQAEATEEVIVEEVIQEEVTQTEVTQEEYSDEAVAQDSSQFENTEEEGDDE
jgi:hypothetical protein